MILFLLLLVVTAKTLSEWVEDNGGFIHRERLVIKASALGGNGLFLLPCNGECEPDPLLLVIPYTLFFHPFSPHLSRETQERIKKLHDSFKSSEPETKFEHLLHYALALEMRNASSFFRPYFASISLPGPFGVSLDDEELDILNTLGDRHGIVKRIVRFGSLAEYHRNTFNKILGQPLLSGEEYLDACIKTGSRSFSQLGWLLGPLIPSEYRERTLSVLIPFLDLVNHHQKDPSTNRYIYYPSRTEGANYSLRWWSSQKEPGELFIVYHPPFRTPLISFTHYGFVVRQNLSAPRKELLEFLDTDESEMEDYLEIVEVALRETQNPVVKQYLKETERVLLFLLGEIGKEDL